MPPKSDIPNNAEIDQALKEFEIKSQIEQMQKSPETSKNSDVPKMVQLVMKLSGGAITEQRQAEYVLLVFTLLIFSISIFVFLGGPSMFQKKVVLPILMPGTSVSGPR